MQPKTETLPNGKEIIVDDGGKSQISPAEQWDHVAFKLIEQVLAPRGFKQIQKGSYRGLVVANALQPGLIKSKVMECQKISAQLVRTYRSKAAKEIRSIIQDLYKWVEEDEKQLRACRFWQFRKKTELKYKIRSLYGQSGSAHKILHLLEHLPIK